MSKAFYITTAIYYVNGQPHLGHAYEKIITDVIARARRSLGQEVFFLTGLDEHGQKVQQAAEAEGKEPQAYCDELAEQWQAFAARLNLSNNDFVRTTQPRHKAVVTAMLNKLHAQGDLYKASYEGWYSWRQETFLKDRDRLPDGTWPSLYGEVTHLKEDNWYFRMGRHQPWLIEHITQHPECIEPDYRRNEILGFLRAEQLEDLCISRPRSRLTWGIAMPFDADYVNYVWFDALSNYYSIPASLGDPAAVEPLAGYYTPPPSAAGAQAPPLLWPCDIHVIGKDIIKFHAVYWPIMLQALGAAVPRQVLVHGWWQKDGQKMSKATGNVVEPLTLIDQWGVDAFRYYVVRELDIGPDGNWTDAGFAGRYEAELANGLGNLVNRSLSMLRRYRQGRAPKPSHELSGQVSAAVETVRQQLLANNLQAALIQIWSVITRANQYVEQTAPFRLAKDPSQAARLDEVLYNLVETCRVLAVLLWPFLPQTAAKIFAQLGLPGEPNCFADATWGRLPAGHTIGEPAPLFPKREIAL